MTTNVPKPPANGRHTLSPHARALAKHFMGAVDDRESVYQFNELAQVASLPTDDRERLYREVRKARRHLLSQGYPLVLSVKGEGYKLASDEETVEYLGRQAKLQHKTSKRALKALSGIEDVNALSEDKRADLNMALTVLDLTKRATSSTTRKKVRELVKHERNRLPDRSILGLFATG